VILALILIAGFIALNSLRSKGSIARALNMALFSVTLPRPASAGSPGASQRPEKELIGIMEQLYGSFTNLHAKGWNKFVYGEPYLALEIAVKHTGQDIQFYMAVPRNFEVTFEKQIHGLYPEAEIEQIQDYSVFHPGGSALGAYVTLKNDSILPVKTYQKLESDPLGEILAGLSKIEHAGEGAALQILFKPSHQENQRSFAQKVVRQMQEGHQLKDAVYRAKHPPKENPGEPQKPKVVTAFEEEAIKSIQSKASKPWFDANVRLVVSAESEPRAKQLLDILSGSLVQFSTNDQNSFSVTKLDGRGLRSLLFNFSFRMFNEGQKILLSSEELASLYHFPVSASSAGVKFVKSKASAPPLNLPAQGIVLGKNTFRGVETLARMTDEDRRRHLYIIGQTGTGKSTLMKALLRQDVENGKGICLIDPHGEFAEFVLSVVPPERAEDVIYFDPGDIDFPMGLNMLEMDPAHPEQKSMVIDEMFLIFDKLYDLKATGGPMFEKYFKNAALLLLDDYAHEVPTLADISRVLVDDAYRADKLTRETNPLVSQFWKLEAEKAQGDQSLSSMAPYITSKITSFIFNEFLRPIVNQSKSAFNFREAMDNGKILVVNLSKGKIGELNANLLGMVIVGKLLMAALSRIDSDESTRKDLYLYIDEFQNFTTDSISTILSEARKYRLDLIVAHQFIKQLKEGIRDAIFGNVGSIASFRIGPDDAEFMKNKFEPVFSPQDLMNIDNLNAYVNLLVNGQTARPFNIKLETERVFGAENPEMVTYLKQLSRSKYSRPRQEVEDEIKAKFNLNKNT
jgi:GTPase SAR1 family protein